MKNKLNPIILFSTINLFIVPTLFAAPGVTKDVVSQVSNSASSWYGSYGNLYLNCLSYVQDQVITYNGWQYAAYYNSQRYVAVARRQLPNGSWSSLSLTDYQQATNDTHNNISMGISSDGRIHLAFDHHDDNLHYRMSVAGLANNPSSTSWNASQFQSIQNNLGSGTITSFTYPRFMLSENGTLLFAGRRGQSGDGDNYIYRYNNNGSWTTVGRFVAGGGENAYFHGMTFSGDRLHLTWCWRASSDGNTNHDLLYAYSDDFGNTWRNNGGTVLSTTGSDPIQLSDNGYRVYTIPQGSRLINQEGMIVDGQGRVHVISREDVGGINMQMHYYRNVSGTWNRINTGIATIIWDNRSKIAYDAAGNVYAVMPNLTIASASVSSNYSDWTTVENSDAGQYFHSEPLIDRKNLLLNNDELYIFAQRGTAQSGSSTLDVIRYTLNAGDTSVSNGPAGYTLCGNEGQTINLSGVQNVAYGANGTYAYLYNVTGNITFDNATFGDPINGVVKFGYCQDAATGARHGLERLASKPKIYLGNNQVIVRLPEYPADRGYTEITVTDLNNRIKYSSSLTIDHFVIPFSKIGTGIHIMTIKRDGETWSKKVPILAQ